MGERLTVLLARAQTGDRSSHDAVIAAAYDALKRLARAKLREGGRHTVLDTTALVHDTYLRLLNVGDLQFDDRRAFFGYAAKVMRSVIVDSARARLAQQRGGDLNKVPLTTDLDRLVPGDQIDLLRVHEALLTLESVDRRAAQMIELRFFGGYHDREIAEIMGITERTVQRDWQKGQALLQAILHQG